MTTTVFCSWTNVKPMTTSSGHWIVESLGSFGDDFDVDAIDNEFLAELHRRLPTGMKLVGDQFYVNLEAAGDRDPVTVDELREIVDSIDLQAIADRHVRE